MKSITFLYKILSICFFCIFIYFVLHKQYVIQSFAKKAEIVTSTKDSSDAKAILLHQGSSGQAEDKISDQKQKKMGTVPEVKIVKNQKVKKSTKDIRKRITTKYKIIEQTIFQEKINNDIISNKYVTITNNITKDMLTYHHWTGKHAPSTFVVSVDGVPIKEGENTKIFYDENNNIVIRYDYSFLKGYKTGSREIYFSPRENEENLELTFSWHTSAHLILESSEIVKDVVVLFNKNLEI